MTDEEKAAAEEKARLDAEVAAEQDRLAKEKADLEAAEKAKTSKDEKDKITDSEAKLLKELMAHKKAAREAAEKAKSLEDKYAGIDIEKLLEAAKAAEEAEVKELERKGEYQRLIEKQKEAHAKEMEEVKNRLKEIQEQAKEAKKATESSTLTNAFANSRFVLDNLTLTPNKTKSLYDGHFQVEEGVIVGYDKPKGAANRTKIVDGAGDPASFDEAMKQIIDSDPDKDSLIKSNLGSGSGSRGTDTRARPTDKKPMTAMEKIAQGLKDSKIV